MLGLLRSLKDPWKLLVAALVAANLIAVVAIVLMLRSKSEAAAARHELLALMGYEKAKGKPRIFVELRKLSALRDVLKRSKLKSTGEADMRQFFADTATRANLPVRRMQTQHRPDRSRKGFVDHIWTVSFKTPIPSREHLAYFLFEIKTRLPQLRIDSIRSGPSTYTDPEKAGTWQPEVVFILTKEEPAEEAAG